MKVIFIAPKSNIPTALINKLGQYAQVRFFEDSPIDIRNIKLLKEKGDKILCPFPEPMAWRFPNEFIKDIPDLKAICLSTTSYHWIDVKLARNLGIYVTNVPNPPNGVAEAAIFAMFAVARKFATVFKEKKFDFEPDNFLQETSDKTMGIVGLGKIGSRIAHLGKSLGMNVVYWSRKTKNDSYQFVSLNRLFKTVDFIFPCLVLNEKTKKFVSKKLIDLMKPSSSIIATINGGIVDINYLLKKVKDKKIYGCALEDDRKTIVDYKGNVFVMPHNNWYTKETVEEKMRIWVDSIISVIKGQPINVVN
jgi:lactate dehydrogenase-like 2-hydroxyacid dehydrogenase